MVEARLVGGALLAATLALTVVSAVQSPEQAPPNDTRFRVMVLQSTRRPPEPGDVDRVFARADQLLGQKTGEHFVRVGFEDVGPGNPTAKVRAYMRDHPDAVPDGFLVLSDDEESVEYGGYSLNVPRPAGSHNRFPVSGGDGFAYVAVIDFFHKYARCGYNDRGVRVSARARGGECHSQRGLQCVDNGNYWMCPYATDDLNAEPDYFMACDIVHEFVHPFGEAGDDDHYRGSVCAARMHFTPAQAADEQAAQQNCGMCPDVLAKFTRAR